MIEFSRIINKTFISWILISNLYNYSSWKDKEFTLRTIIPIGLVAIMDQQYRGVDFICIMSLRKLIRRTVKRISSSSR